MNSLLQDARSTLDLSQFDFAPLIAFTGTPEISSRDRGILRGLGGHGADRRTYTQASGGYPLGTLSRNTLPRERQKLHQGERQLDLLLPRDRQERRKFGWTAELELPLDFERMVLVDQGISGQISEQYY